MNGVDLHRMAPFGAKVKFSDGKSQPPARHHAKLRIWKRTNGEGIFARAGGTSVGIMTESGPVMVSVIHFQTDDRDMSYEVTPPEVGTVLAFGIGGLQHAWRSWAEARAWAARNRYDLNTCGYSYSVVSMDGSREPAVAPGAAP